MSYTKQRGVTLVELMIGLAIIAILTTLVAPSVQTLLIQNRIVAEINEVSSVIQFARANAIDEQTNTVVCPSSDFKTCNTNWNNPRMVFVDLDNDGKRHTTNEPILVALEAISKTNRLSGPNNSIVFRADGAANNPATLMLCHQGKNNKYARAVSVNMQGRVKMSRDSNNNGIYEKADGTPLNCA